MGGAPTRDSRVCNVRGERDSAKTIARKANYRLRDSVAFLVADDASSAENARNHPRLLTCVTYLLLCSREWKVGRREALHANLITESGVY